MATKLKTSKYCCQDFKLGMDKLDQSIVLASVRAGIDTYTSKLFVFCPWCGKKIKHN